MTAATPHPPAAPDPAARPAGRYRGQVVYVYAFDLAHEIRRPSAGTLLGQPIVQFGIDAGKRAPRQLFFYRPEMVRLPAVERAGPRGAVAIDRTVKLFSIGAVSITIRVPFVVAHSDQLVDYHDLRFAEGSVHDEARNLAEAVRRELAPYCTRPVAQLGDEEAYTVFHIEAPVPGTDGKPQPAEVWHRQHRRQVAALLTQEPDPANLSTQETQDNTQTYVSYYQQDLVVVDWDAALVIDEARNLEETLHIIELANVQLAELEAYDRILDDAIDRAYRDLRGGGTAWRSRGVVRRDLREIRVDFTRVTDELSNITKFFGDWHLARVHQALAGRFHLADWHRTIDDKLRMLDGLYQLLQQDRTNRWMMILEATIVLLFILDLIILVIGLGP